MNENKKLLDLEGLQRYDGKIKTYSKRELNAVIRYIEKCT